MRLRAKREVERVVERVVERETRERVETNRRVPVIPYVMQDRGKGKLKN